MAVMKKKAPPKEDPRDIELRVLHARIKTLEADRHDMHEMVTHLNNRADSERIFINGLINSWMRKGEMGLVELLGQIKEGLAQLPVVNAQQLIERQSLARPDTQGAGTRVIEGSLA